MDWRLSFQDGATRQESEWEPLRPDGAGTLDDILSPLEALFLCSFVQSPAPHSTDCVFYFNVPLYFRPKIYLRFINLVR